MDALNVSSSFRRSAPLGNPTIGFLWANVAPSVDPRVWASMRGTSASDIARECDQLWHDFVRGSITTPNRFALRGNHESGNVKDVRQLLRFPMKLRTSSKVRAEDAIEAFRKVEDEIMFVDPDPSLLASLNSIIVGWTRNIDMTNLPFGHGPGAVSEGNVSVADKYRLLGRDTMLDYAYPGETWCGPFRRVSRLVVVPKTILKDRTICAEPCTLMYFQKGVQRRLYDYICAHPYLGSRIPLRNQARNGDLALKASASAWRWEGPWDKHTCATLDLSAASDRLSWTVVQRLFQSTPLLRHLWATRSRAVEMPDGVIKPLRKFAAMGSALCFPIQSLVFAACCEEAARAEPRHEFRTWSVFGDDIICHASITDRVMRNLRELGLVINPSKSFWGLHPFRESCGVEAYDGEDVTPFTCTGLERSSEGLLAALDLASRLARAEKYVASWIVYSWAYQNFPPSLRPYLDIGPDGSYYFLWDLCQGERKRVKRYQRTFRPLIAARMRDQKIPNDELRLTHVLLSFRMRKPPRRRAMRPLQSIEISTGVALTQPITDPYECRPEVGPLTVAWV